MKQAILIDDRDTVLTVLEELAVGDSVGTDVETITATERIPIYHKIARTDLAIGDSIYKYGERMGYATAPIAKGSWVHTHNADSRLEGGKS